MQYQSIFIALMATSAYADTWPWVSSFKDDNCKGPGAGDVVNVYGGCSTFNPTYDTVLVNFGGGDHETDSVMVYSDDNCTQDEVFVNASWAASTPAQCHHMTANGGAKWRSARMAWYPQ